MGAAWQVGQCFPHDRGVVDLLEAADRQRHPAGVGCLSAGGIRSWGCDSHAEPFDCPRAAARRRVVYPGMCMFYAGWVIDHQRKSGLIYWQFTVAGRVRGRCGSTWRQPSPENARRSAQIRVGGMLLADAAWMPHNPRRAGAGVPRYTQALLERSLPFHPRKVHPSLLSLSGAGASRIVRTAS